jgi:hypothetical protein
MKEKIYCRLFSRCRRLSCRAKSGEASKNICLEDKLTKLRLKPETSTKYFLKDKSKPIIDLTTAEDLIKKIQNGKAKNT